MWELTHSQPLANQAAADAAKGKGIEVITVAVNTGSSLDVDFLFWLNSTGLGFQVDSFDDAEDVTLRFWAKSTHRTRRHPRLSP